MPRTVWFHVVSRGSADAPSLLDSLAATDPVHRVEFHAYCVMGTHVHLLLRLLGDDPGASLRAVGERLPGAPRAIPVSPGRPLLAVTRYLHLNPVVAGLVPRPEDWPWSSYRAYLNPALAEPWLHTRVVLAALGTFAVHARYRVYVEEGLSAPQALEARRGRGPSRTAAEASD